MTAKNVVLLLVAIGALVAAVVIAANHFMNQPDPESTLIADQEHWLCMNEECGRDFTLDRAQTREMLRSGRAEPACPYCGGDFVMRVFRCEHCARPVMPEGHFVQPAVCPHCGQALTPP